MDRCMACSLSGSRQRMCHYRTYDVAVYPVGHGTVVERSGRVKISPMGRSMHARHVKDGGVRAAACVCTDRAMVLDRYTRS